jgi:hypothetical protein
VSGDSIFENLMTVSRYRLLHDFLGLTRGTEIQLSVGGDYYPRDKRWGKNEFRPGPAVEGCPDTFAPHDVSDAEWESINTDLSHELGQ